jgi:H+/Cl- antiporter ClcA
MLGGSFHNVAQKIFGVAAAGSVAGQMLQLADVPAYAMIGAACVLAALFRAPLTASLVLFELTRDYDVILPLMASAGMACVVGDVIDAKFEQIQNQMRPRRDQDAVSWGDLADKEVNEKL